MAVVDLAPYGTRFHAFALIHDRLGWCSFLEGRISTILVQEMHFHLTHTRSLLSAIDWAKQLVNHLVRITHRQWTYRNSVVHFTVEGRTPKQHREIIAELEQLMSVDPKTLLPKYHHLFEDEDFVALGRGSSNHKLYWISAAKTSIAASAIAHKQRRQERRNTQIQRAAAESTDAPAAHPIPRHEPDLPCEQGFRYKKRRLK
jgi:hypothetical protein